MCVYVCAHLCVHVWRPDTNVKCLCIVVSFLHFRQGLSLNLKLIVLARLAWPGRPWDPPVSVLTAPQLCAATSGFSMGATVLKSGLHAYTASTLPNMPFPQCPDSSLLLTCDLGRMNPGNLYTSGLRSNSQEGLEAQRMRPGTQIS